MVPKVQVKYIGYEKLAFFDQYVALFRKRYKIRPSLQWKTNRSSYAFYGIKWCHFQWLSTTPNLVSRSQLCWTSKTSKMVHNIAVTMADQSKVVLWSIDRRHESYTLSRYPKLKRWQPYNSHTRRAEWTTDSSSNAKIKPNDITEHYYVNIISPEIGSKSRTNYKELQSKQKEKVTV